MNTLLLIGGIGMQEILVSFKDGVNGLEKEIDNDESTHRNPKDNEPSK